jgi:F420 biosynthesis protein FbiB-like protein
MIEDKAAPFGQTVDALAALESMIKSRRAIRRYRTEPVPEKLLNRILNGAMWAPSAHNRQPWRFAVLTEFEGKDRLAKAMGARLRADRQADGDTVALIEKDVNRSHARITGAPVIIVICLSMADMDSYPDERRSNAERTMAVQSVAMAAQNIWLLAQSAGLGACWLCAPLFVPALVQDVLALPADWEPVGMISMGWPAEEKEKTRNDWSNHVMYLDNERHRQEE